MSEQTCEECDRLRGLNQHYAAKWTEADARTEAALQSLAERTGQMTREISDLRAALTEAAGTHGPASYVVRLRGRAEAAERACEDAKRREQEASAKMQAMAQSESNKALRARAESAERESASLRLMLRETAATNTSGIAYALRCQRERDEARAAFLECAQAIGVVYEADGHATAPGPVDVVVAYIREANRRSMAHIECEMGREQMHRRAQEAERLVGLAMRVGQAECEAMRARMQSAERALTGPGRAVDAETWLRGIE